MSSAAAPPPRRRFFGVTILLMLAAAAWGTYSAWSEQQTRTLPLDVDGWGYATKLIDADRGAVRELFRRPSLWKGPVVPTVYGLAYFVLPHPATILGVNVLAFALSAGLMHRLFLAGGGDVRASTLAIVGWIVYPPHRLVFGYYFAEGLITLFSTVLLWLAVRRPDRPFLIGLFAGLTLLARPPMLLVVAGLPLAVPSPSLRDRSRWLLRYGLGAALTFLPWGVRNYVVTGTFVPFTTEGGRAMFLGTYLPFDTIHWQKLVAQPEVAELEAAAPSEDQPVEQMKYWSGLAKTNVKHDPAGQVTHAVRKGVRFWANVPDGQWLPTWLSTLPPLSFLPLAAWAAVRYRRFPLVRLCLLWIVGLWLMHAAVVAVMRYSFPVLPLVLFLAAQVFLPPRVAASGDNSGGIQTL